MPVELRNFKWMPSVRKLGSEMFNLQKTPWFSGLYTIPLTLAMLVHLGHLLTC